MKRWLCTQPTRILVPTEPVEPVSVSVTAHQFLSKILVLPSPLDTQGLGERETSGPYGSLASLWRQSGKTDSYGPAGKIQEPVQRANKVTLRIMDETGPGPQWAPNKW